MCQLGDPSLAPIGWRWIPMSHSSAHTGGGVALFCVSASTNLSQAFPFSHASPAVRAASLWVRSRRFLAASKAIFSGFARGSISIVRLLFVAEIAPVLGSGFVRCCGGILDCSSPVHGGGLCELLLCDKSHSLVVRSLFVENFRLIISYL